MYKPDQCSVCLLEMDSKSSSEELLPVICNLCGEEVHSGCMEPETGEWCLTCDKGEEEEEE